MSQPDLFADLGLGEPLLQQMGYPEFEEAGLRFSWLRLDLMHPTLGGNKWFKLKHNLMRIVYSDCRRVISFGGAYSNHLLALAEAGDRLGIETVGVIRGELPEPLNPALSRMRQLGMQLVAMSRSDYRRKQEPAFCQKLLDEFGPAWILPEGGSNGLAVKGLAELAKYLPPSDGSPGLVCCASGTGATLAGLGLGIEQLASNWQALGLAVLKGEGYIQQQIDLLLSQASAELQLSEALIGRAVGRLLIDEDCHCGGYAKVPADLASFVRRHNAQYGLALEPVYTGKLLYGLSRRARAGQFQPGSTLIALHTGGLQGVK